MKNIILFERYEIKTKYILFIDYFCLTRKEFKSECVRRYRSHLTNKEIINEAL